MKEAQHTEGPLITRVLLVLSSMSPLFALWMIRGTTLIPELQFRLGCLAMILVPNAFLGLYLWDAARRGAQRTIKVGDVDDRRQDVISYLFAMLLPFYTADLTSWPNLIATVAAFVMVVVLFVALGLHYMNFLFSVFGYHCFQIHTPDSDQSSSSEQSFMVITRNRRLPTGSDFTGYEISSTVLFEVRPWKSSSISAKSTMAEPTST